MARVELRNLGKRFGETTAVAGVDLEIHDGEFLVLVGPSGCGKTTVLRMIAGLTEVSEGDILLGERRVNDLAPRDRNVAMVFQNYALYPHLDVFENMAFGLRLRRLRRSEIERRVREAAGLLGLEELLRRKPRELSGGQRQRVALGRAIVREPDLFLMDEPLSNLDANLRVQTRAELIRLHRRLGITTLYVTHDQVEAMTMAGRLAVMRGGRVEQVGTPLEIYERPANRFVAGFIGSPPMNFLAGQLELREGAAVCVVEGAALALPEERFAAARQPAGEAVALGVRPEDLSLGEAGAEGEGLEATVQVVETLGAETLAYLETTETTLIARLPGQERPEIGRKARVRIDLARAHLFSAEDGKTLR